MSSSSASLTGRIAAIADAPQIENPVATSRLRPLDRPIFLPNHCVPVNVIATTIITSARPGAPSWRTCVKDSCRPSKTMPRRSRFRAEKPRPRRQVSGSKPKFDISAPSTTASTSGDTTTGVLFLTSDSTTNAIVATAAAMMRPGKCFVVNIAFRD